MFTSNSARENQESKGGAVMRVLACPCGITLNGADDEELFRLGRQHADEHHPSDNITDEFIREHIRTSAHD
jgi:predicted small metal-binding protein